MDPVNILHLTDLHLRNPADWDSTVLLNALFDDLKKMSNTQFRPHLVIFSGDLAREAGAAGAYSPVFDMLLRILEIVKLDEERLIVCPGNHDVDRNQVGPNLPALQKYRNEASTNYGLNLLVEKSDFKLYVSNVFEPYNGMAEMFATSSVLYQTNFSSSYFFRDLGLSLVTVNTATLSAGGLTAEFNDLGKLALAERSLIEALDKVPSAIRPIVVGHHPTSWLNEENQNIVERILATRARAYLSGHLHEVVPKQSRLLGGSFLHAQSGALYCGRPYWNGYSILTLNPDLGHFRIAYRRWFEQRRAFSKAEDLGDEGLFYSSDEAETYWKAVTPAIDQVVVEKWRGEQLFPYVAQKVNDSLSGADFLTYFVQPDFEREIPYRVEADGRMGSRVEILSFEDVVNSEVNFVISAQNETGKSTLLKQIAFEVGRSPLRASNWILPAVIQFGSIKSYRTHIEKLIRDQLENMPAEITITSLLEKGHLLILVDDVDFAQKPKREALVSFVSRYPKCRFVFASSTTFVEMAALQPEIVPDVPFTRIRMRAFRKGQLQILVEKHGLTDPFQVDRMVERVMRDASALNVPLTAVTGTFLIQILREEPDSTVINQAALIERYIEMLLQKYAPRELIPGAFDFRNKVDLLCNIAEKMTFNDNYSPDLNDVIQWSISYLKQYGLRFSAADLISYFIEARIFELEDGRVRFRLRMFFEFFAATRMIDSEEFRDYIFNDDRYLCFINEIGFYSALNRKDKKQMERIFERFSALTAEIWPSEDGRSDATSVLRTMKLPSKKTSEDELDALQSSINSPTEIAQSRKDLAESTDFEDQERTQTVIRQKPQTPQEIWIGHLLLISGMVKHMELIPDVDKRRLLARALDGWARFIVTSLSVVPDLSRNKKVIFNGVTYRSSLADDLSVGETARRLTLYMPIAIAKMATTFIGTEKLRDQLEDGIGNKEEPMPRQFLRISILSDLGIEGIAVLAEKVSKGIRNHGYLEQVFARKMYEVAIRFRLKKDDFTGIKSIVGDVFTNLSGDTKGTQRRKAEIISAVNQQRIQIEMAKKVTKSD